MFFLSLEGSEEGDRTNIQQNHYSKGVSRYGAIVEECSTPQEE